MRIEIEKKYNKDYQADRYRAKILDDDGKIMISGTEDFFSEEEALADSEGLLKIAKRMEDGVGFDRGKWQNPDRYIRYFAFAMAYFGFWFVLFFVLLIITLSPATLFVILIPMFVFIFLSRYFIREKYIYLVEKDVLYAIFLINREHVTSTRYILLDVLNMYLFNREHKNIRDINDYAESLHDYTKFDMKKEIWEIQSVIELKEYRKNKYRVKCKVEKYYKGKTKNKVFYISNYYNDYESLIKFLEFMRDNS